MTNQPNSDKKEQDRWEAFLDTVFAKSRSIQRIEMGRHTRMALIAYLQNREYADLWIGLESDNSHLWTVPVILSDIADSPKIVYHTGPLPKPPKPKKEKVVDTWMDDEV